MMNTTIALLLLVIIIITIIVEIECDYGDAFGLISRVLTECEYDSLTIGSKLVDNYNNYDENTEHHYRLYNDYIVKNMGFAHYLDSGINNSGLTSDEQSTVLLRKLGGWYDAMLNPIASSYWAITNKWVYFFGDLTLRQLWTVFAAPQHGIDIEQSSKNWTRENCQQQYPNRIDHSQGEHFPEEGWGGHCGQNEYTCHLPGFGSQGKLTFDWKHFPYEDYDRWLFGPDGVWSNDSSVIRPDVLVVQTGLHTCMHAIHSPAAEVNEVMINEHVKQVGRLMKNVKKAILRPRADGKPPTTVIFSLAGRVLAGDHRSDECTWSFNRKVARTAHTLGFPVFEREEIEHRALFKSEFSPPHARIIKAESHHLHKNTEFHMPGPVPQMVSTALLNMITCIARNGTDYTQFPPYNNTVRDDGDASTGVIIDSSQL